MTTPLNIALDQATVGMTLSKDLTDSRGNILLPCNAVLTEKMINVLTRHNISEISVIADKESGASDEATEQLKLQEKMARIELLFKTHEHEAINLQLKNYIINFNTASHHGKN